MLYSLHNHHFNYGYENLADFEAALGAEEDRRRGQGLPGSVSSGENWHLLYRESVKCAEQLERYVDTFGWERVHVILFDDFISDTARAYRIALRFLGVGPHFQPRFRKINLGGQLRSRTLLNFLNKPPRLVRKLTKAVMPQPIVHEVTKGLRHLNMGPRLPMREELRRQLQKESLPEVEKLSKLLGRDLTHWCLD